MNGPGKELKRAAWAQFREGLRLGYGVEIRSGDVLVKALKSDGAARIPMRRGGLEDVRTLVVLVREEDGWALPVNGRVEIHGEPWWIDEARTLGNGLVRARLSKRSLGGVARN